MRNDTVRYVGHQLLIYLEGVDIHASPRRPDCACALEQAIDEIRAIAYRLMGTSDDPDSEVIDGEDDP